MTDNDFNLIVPVENLHNIQSLTPTKERQERKRRQKPPGQRESDEEPRNETPQESPPKQDDDPHEIDYRA